MTAVEPILPTEARVHLLTSIAPAPSSVVAAAFSPSGVSFMSGIECGKARGWPVCQDDDAAEKTADGFDDAVTFLSFYAYHSVECDGYVHEQSEARKAQYARTTFDAVKHSVLATQLWYSDVETTNPSLRSSAALAWASAATAFSDPINVIARLVAARVRLAGSGTVLIHGPLVLVPYLVSQGLIVEQGGRYVGPGFVYVTDDGYPDDVSLIAGSAGPTTISDGGGGFLTYADAPGEVWLYASGRVEFALGRYVGKSVIGATLDNDGAFSEYTTWDSRRNKTSILVEQEAFLRFDPCSVLAAKTVIPVHDGAPEIVVLTQAEYDALGTYDPDTIYVIVG